MLSRRKADNASTEDDEGSTEVHRDPPTGGQRFFGYVRELLLIIVLGLIVSTLLRTFVFQPFEIPSGSMENTLQIDDRVAVQKVSGFQRGDVVVFEDPGGWLPAPDESQRPSPARQVLEFVGLAPNTSDQFLIKRVIGVEGDQVVCCDTVGRMMVNGQPLEEGSYLYSTPEDGTVSPSDVQFEVTVPKGRIFVMGDHRNASADSRCHLADLDVDGTKGDNAFVPTDKVVGVAFAKIYPFDRFGGMTRPDTFGSVPAPALPAPDKPKIEPEGVLC
ncbi:MAG: signal peptidase I [Propionibacteriales bacterium]|nr:signal peptidase I [Propionibacteriales bacterium]